MCWNAMYRKNGTSLAGKRERVQLNGSSCVLNSAMSNKMCRASTLNYVTTRNYAFLVLLYDIYIECARVVQRKRLR